MPSVWFSGRLELVLAHGKTRLCLFRILIFATSANEDVLWYLALSLICRTLIWHRRYRPITAGARGRPDVIHRPHSKSFVRISLFLAAPSHFSSCLPCFCPNGAVAARPLSHIRRSILRARVSIVWNNRCTVSAQRGMHTNKQVKQSRCSATTAIIITSTTQHM